MARVAGARWPPPSMALAESRDAGGAGSRDGEPGVPSATCLGCRRDGNVAIWGRREMRRGSLWTWRHNGGVLCEPAAVSPAER